jgi:hypothetical protein
MLLPGAVSVSRVNAVKFRFDGSEYRSTLERGPEELAILAWHGHFGDAQLHPDQASRRGSRRPARPGQPTRRAWQNLSRPWIHHRRRDGVLGYRPRARSLRASGDRRERSTGGGNVASLRDWFTQALGSVEFADQLSAFSRRLEVGKGEIIATQGNPAGSMHFILEGRVGIIAKMDDRSVRVRSLGPRKTIGKWDSSLGSCAALLFGPRCQAAS